MMKKTTNDETNKRANILNETIVVFNEMTGNR